MAIITKSTSPSMDANQNLQVAAGELYAGEDLEAVSPCYIKQSDGKVYLSDGAAANEAASIHGWTPKSYLSGEPVTLYGYGTRFKYGSGMTPGDRFYLAASDAYTEEGASPGIDTAATTGDAVGVAFAVSATDIVVLTPR